MIVFISKLFKDHTSEQNRILQKIDMKLIRDSGYQPCHVTLEEHNTIDEDIKLIEHSINLSSHGFDVVVECIGHPRVAYKYSRELDYVGAFEPNLIWLKESGDLFEQIGFRSKHNYLGYDN